MLVGSSYSALPGGAFVLHILWSGDEPFAELEIDLSVRSCWTLKEVAGVRDADVQFWRDQVLGPDQLA
jgi:hypothetical protein